MIAGPLTITGGRLVLGDGEPQPGALRCEGGRIVALGDVTPHEGDVVFDARGALVAPGLVDVHVHFRDPGLTYKEDIETGSRAAAHGGFTDVGLTAFGPARRMFCVEGRDIYEGLDRQIPWVEILRAKFRRALRLPTRIQRLQKIPSNRLTILRAVLPIKTQA